jgi:predicted nucleic-acid-binding Zn-ribbon protein
MNSDGLKEIKYICKNCGYTEIKRIPSTSIPELIIHCPECRRISFERHEPSYIERMKK